MDGLLLDDGPDLGQGRLVAEDEESHPDDHGDLVAHDAGIDGGTATAREAAFHAVNDDVSTSAPATGDIADRAPDLRPVLSSGRTSLPVRPVDSTDVRIAVLA